MRGIAWLTIPSDPLINTQIEAATFTAGATNFLKLWIEAKGAFTAHDATIKGEEIVLEFPYDAAGANGFLADLGTGEGDMQEIGCSYEPVQTTGYADSDRPVCLLVKSTSQPKIRIRLEKSFVATNTI